jgi:hypothetical protein
MILPKRKIRTVAEFYAAFPDTREVIVDGMERPRQRPQKTSGRKHCSGKKKRHTPKAILITQGRRIGYLSPSKRGARHDKRLLGQRHILPHIPPDVNMFGGSGLQGLRHPGACLPYQATKSATSPKSSGSGTNSSPPKASLSNTRLGG